MAKLRFLQYQKQNEVMVSVSDNGVGISKNTIEKIFRFEESISTPVHKKSRAQDWDYCCARNLFQNIGGKIWVESELGKGSTFYFTIPKIRLIRN